MGKTTLALSKKRDEDSDLGGTMRLGKQVVPVKPGTLAAEVYGKEVGERHRHRYEVNNSYCDQFEKAGMVISARTPGENLPEIIGTPRSFLLHSAFSSIRNLLPLRVSVIRSSINSLKRLPSITKNTKRLSNRHAVMRF